MDVLTESDNCVWEKTAIFSGFHGAHFTGPVLKRAFNAAISAQEARAGQRCECFQDIPFEALMARLFPILSISHAKRYPNMPEASNLPSIRYQKEYVTRGNVLF